MSALGNPRQHDDLLNYRLKRVVTLGGAPAIRLCEGGFGVTRREWRFVAALVEDGDMAPSDLSKRTQMDQGCVSMTVKALVFKGLVERLEQSGDRRRALLRATSAGHELYRLLFPQLARINKRILEVLTEGEIHQLDLILLKLMQRVQEIHAEGGGVDVRTDRHLGGSQRFWRARKPGDPIARRESPR